MFEKVEEKSFYGPWRQDGWVLGLPPSIIVRNRAPFGAGLARKVLFDDNLSPFSSDKIRAKILDLVYGGAHRALQGIWSGTPWSGSIQKSMAFWIAGLERHSNYWSADCKLMWSVTWHSKRLHSRCLSTQIDCRESQLFPLKI